MQEGVKKVFCYGLIGTIAAEGVTLYRDNPAIAGDHAQQPHIEANSSSGAMVRVATPTMAFTTSAGAALSAVVPKLPLEILFERKVGE